MKSDAILAAAEAVGSLDFYAKVTRPLSCRRLTILVYHRVGVPGAVRFLSDRTLSATPEEFGRHMSWLVRHCSVVSLGDVSRAFAGSARLPRRAVAVTFDDGYLDNFLHAFPVLKSLGIPATIFLVTGQMGRREPFWWERVHAALAREGRSDTEVRAEMERLKELPDELRSAAVCSLSERAGLNGGEFPRTVLTWEEVRDMAAHGIDFGGHTVTHPILTRVDIPSATAEIKGCFEAIRKELKREPLAFAYPVGRSFSINAQVANAVRETGFSLALTTDYGRNLIPGADPFLLRRIGIGLEDGAGRFKAKVLCPRFFAPRTPASGR